ncbi:MAG: hypothetical protein E7378_03280 [Clostridiales bacterium]|nr:hypothetical protein [Clostridiales bacterium]
MKKVYYVILTILTILMLGLLTFNNLNNAVGWVDLTQYQTVIGYIGRFGPMVLLCCFAFGSLIGRISKKILIVVIAILLIIFAISVFAPHWITAIFGQKAPAMFIL